MTFPVTLEMSGENAAALVALRQNQKLLCSVLRTFRKVGENEMTIKNKRVVMHRELHPRTEESWTADEYSELQRRVSESGLTRSEYIRRCALDQKIESTLDAQLINTLSKLGGLQIKLNTELRGELHKNNADSRINELIKAHNDLYRDICNCIRELRG